MHAARHGAVHPLLSREEGRAAGDRVQAPVDGGGTAAGREGERAEDHAAAGRVQPFAALPVATAKSPAPSVISAAAVTKVVDVMQ